MRRNEIERRVNEKVFDCYDHGMDTLDVSVPLGNEVTAIITKEPGGSPGCVIIDDRVEGDKELFLPNVCAFIEKVVEECVKDIREQQEFEGYDDEPPVTLTRNDLHWNSGRFNW